MKKLFFNSLFAVLALACFTGAWSDAFDVSSFAKKMTITMSGYTGSSSLDGFPVLVKLSTNITGFAYTDFQSTNGSDLRFAYYDNGSSSLQALPFEIDTWDTNGTSLIWVRIPSLTKDTGITAYYGSTNPLEVTASDVWKDYVGVWHMLNEAGVTRDSTANGNHATNRANVSAVSAGLIGAAEHMATGVGNSVSNGSGTVVPASSSLGIALGSQFSVSGWYCLSTNAPNWAYLISEKILDNSASWGLQFGDSGQTTSFRVYPSTSPYPVACPRTTAGQWVRFDVAYDGAAFNYYTNGLLAYKTNGVVAAAHATNSLAIGAALGDIYGGVLGDMDEVRILSSVASADRVKAEYDTVVSDSFAVPYRVNGIDGPEFYAPPVFAWSGSSWKFSTKLSSGTGVVNFVVSGRGTNSVLYPPETSLAPTNLETEILLSDPFFVTTFFVTNTCYAYSVWATNAAGDIGYRPGTNSLLNGVVSVSATDAAEADLATPGTFVLSRPDTGTNYDLIVTYALSGSAVAGVNYVAVPGSVTIPAGSASATVNIYPLRTKTGDHDLTLTVTSDACLVDASSQATLKIAAFVVPSGTNTWIATGTGVADPTDTNNWSLGTVPAATDDILVDGRYSQASMSWTSNMTSTVASWTQSADYTGTVTFATTYAHYSTVFTNFVVTGDCSLLGGTWTHPLSYSVSASRAWPTGIDIQTNEQYRLSLSVVGTLTIGADGTISAMGKGHYQNSNAEKVNHYSFHAGSANRQGTCYGDVKRPEDIGTGSSILLSSYRYAAGGGAIRINAGTVVVNGTIEANANADLNAGSAAAGSILIDASTITGTGSIRAEGAVARNSSGSSCSSGGRIALWTTMPVDQTTLTVSAGASANGYNTCGTVYLRDSTMTHGRLIVDNLLSRSGEGEFIHLSSVPVTTNGDWTFYGILLGGTAHLEIPAGTTLRLPNGLASISSTNATSTALYTGIYYNGGTLDLGSETEHVLDGPFVFCSFTTNVFTGNLTLRNGAAIGLVRSQRHATEGADLTNSLATCTAALTIDGDLTVEPTATGLSAAFAGLAQTSGSLGSGYACCAHGGTYKSNTNYTYDSIFNPFLPGLNQFNSYANREGGGVLNLTVTGKLTLNAQASADSYTSNGDGSGAYAGGAGALNIICGSLSGSSRIHANGLFSWCGGGRVAVRLTDAGATFADFGITNITATGHTIASPGTVYLQAGSEAEGAGTIYVNPKSSVSSSYSATNATPIPANGAHPDEASAFKKANLVLLNKGAVSFTTNLTFAAITVDVASKLDLLGHAVKTDKLFLGGKKIPAGIYHAADAAVSDYVLDSAGSDGTITVCKFAGFYIIVQ